MVLFLLRGTTVYSGRPTVWTGKVALMYPSDYGYATDFTKCSLNLYNYSSSTDSYACRANDWIYNSAAQWLLTPASGYSNGAWYVYSACGVNGSSSVYGVPEGERGRSYKGIFPRKRVPKNLKK